MRRRRSLGFCSCLPLGLEAALLLVLFLLFPWKRAAQLVFLKSNKPVSASGLKVSEQMWWSSDEEPAAFHTKIQ